MKVRVPTSESWKNDLPGLNKQVLESVCKTLAPFNLTVKNSEDVEVIRWHREPATDVLDKDWAIRFSRYFCIICRLFPDSVSISCRLFVKLNNSQQLIDAAEIMKDVRIVFKDIQAEEVEDEDGSTFRWDMKVEYDALTDTVEKIVEGLRSANQSSPD